MTTRTVTGTILQPDGTAYTSASAAEIELLETILSGSVIYPKGVVHIVTSGTGTFTQLLAVPDTGTAPYKITFADGKEATFSIGTGASVDISTLITL